MNLERNSQNSPKLKSVSTNVKSNTDAWIKLYTQASSLDTKIEFLVQ